jgi:hypothetical protein
MSADSQEDRGSPETDHRFPMRWLPASPRQQALVAVVLGVASILVTGWATLGIEAPIGMGFDSQESIRYHRLISFLFAVSVFMAAIALRVSDLTIHSARLLGFVVGGAGLIAGGGSLLILIMLCGPQVVWWGCSP